MNMSFRLHSVLMFCKFIHFGLWVCSFSIIFAFFKVPQSIVYMKLRKQLAIAALLPLCLCATAQNLQLHYDLGHTLNGDLSGRPCVTTTIEMFKPDRWGSTFLFADIDYFHDGVAGVYWEVSRELNVSSNKQWAAHMEYNGGASSSQHTQQSTRFQHAVLVGPAWNWHSADYARTLSLQAMYKYYFKGQNPWNQAYSSFQATAVWGMQMARGLCTLSGFLDCWYDPNVDGKWILLSEPQFWVNLNHLRHMEGFNLSLGTEVELSNNFVWDDKGRNNRFHAIPTLAMKWAF